LNLRPLDPQSSALPSCATARACPRPSGSSHEGELYYGSRGPGTVANVARWICPNCEREFAARVAHVCVPGISVTELLGRHPAWVAEVYRAIIEHLNTLGPVYEDAVDVGVFLKSDRKVATFRPKVRSAELWLFLPEIIDHPRISRSGWIGEGRAVNLVKLTAAGEVDDQVRTWLTLAYDLNTD